jgi:hypothetical protein
MNKVEHDVDGKKITIIDNLFTAKERLTFYKFICRNR